MKIMIVFPIDGSGVKIGGIETSISNYITSAPDNLEIELIGVSLIGGKEVVGEWNDVCFEGRKIRFFPVLAVRDPNKYSIIPLVFKFSKALSFFKNKIDFSGRLIVFHRIEPSLVLRDVKEKKILFVHGDMRNLESGFSENHWKRLKGLYFFLEKFLIEQMSKIFIVSKSGCDFYKNRYPGIRSRFEFIPTWFDPGTFYVNSAFRRSDFLNSIGVNKEKFPIIISVGRLERPKDPVLLIRTFSFVKKSYPDAHLVIIGEGALKETVRKKISELMLKDDVTLVGRKRQAEIAPFYRAADLFLLTSAFEGMPKAALEAGASGLPIVATNTGEMRLIVKNGVNGELVDSREPYDLALAVERTLQRELPKEAIAREVNAYSEEKILSQINSWFER